MAKSQRITLLHTLSFPVWPATFSEKNTDDMCTQKIRCHNTVGHKLLRAQWYSQVLCMQKAIASILAEFPGREEQYSWLKVWRATTQSVLTIVT